ncbi:MAG: prolyl oligopeptidase family serine peptidase [Owenweeksia sp.]|nr:prolyl oligopeptidase family serine peptidase [Owenweeksia sp.]
MSNDGKTIYFTDNRETDKNQLKSFNIPTEKLNTAASSPNTDILPFGNLLNTRHRPAIAVSIFAKSQQHLVDTAYAEDLAILQKKIKGDLSFAGQSQDGQVLLIREFTGGPQNLYRYQRQTKELVFLLNEIPHLAGKSLAQRTAHSVITTDSMELPIHVYLPPGKDTDQDGIPQDPLPTLLYVHGGPWVGLIHFNSWLHLRHYQLLANRGYAVVVCEFRGTTGLGKKLIEASYKKWGTDMARDKVDIAEWLVQQKITDKDKIGIWGWSYGGYAALAGVSLLPQTYACGISLYGPTALQADSAAPSFHDPFWKFQVGDPATDQALLRAQSPRYHAQNFKDPVLITTGSQDSRVPKAGVDAMAEALHQTGKDVTYFYYPNEGHDFRQKSSWVSFWALAEQFLQKYLDGQSEPLGDDLDAPGFAIVFDPHHFYNP